MLRILAAIVLCVLLARAAGAQSEALGPRSVDHVHALIDAAAEGETVRVPAGVYEGNLIVRKPITLDGGAGVVFDGLGKGTVIEIRAEGVTIHGCTVRGSGGDVTTEPAGIRVLAGSATIEANTIEDTLFGIDLREASDSVVRGNSVTGMDLEAGRRGDGVRLWWSHNCIIEGNTARGVRDMVFWYSENLRLNRNTVTDSRYGLHFMYSHDTMLEDNRLSANSVGVYLMYSHRITLVGNRMLNNRGASGYGIGLKDCDDIAINHNALLANRVGVYIDNSPSSIGSSGLFEANMVAFNEIGLLATPNTHDNVFTGNAFVENEEAAATHGRGQLVSNAFAREGVGNYWSDYAGFDLDADGIGDLAHEPRSLFGAMLANEPNLRLFVHSPAQQAIEFTGRALPELRPASVLVDPSPLALPPTIDTAAADPGADGVRMAVGAAVLLSMAGACVIGMGIERGLPATKSGGRS